MNEQKTLCELVYKKSLKAIQTTLKSDQIQPVEIG